jgi:hypothetical protein
MNRLGPRSWTLALVAALCGTGAAAQSGGGVVYRCPGPPVLYTDTLTPAEAKERGCRTIEGAPVTVMQSRPRPAPAPAAASAAPAAAPAGARVDPAEQRRRDSDRRSILETELRREEQKLAEMRREYNDGQPERLGSERNYQRYLDRVAQMRADIERKEGDIAAIKRELAKLPN